ncbi:MAG: PstS family phosphate ABC transporter substrate-binding protein [Bacteroidales bacterium]
MRKNLQFLLLLLHPVFILLLFGCQGPASKSTADTDELSGTISVSGAWALYPMTVKWAEEFQKLHPRVRIDISAGGAGKGFTDAITGMVDLGMFSRGFTQQELDRGIWYIGVTKDAVIPVMNQKNPFLEKLLTNGISREKFQQIFIERSITKWNQLAEVQSNDDIHVFTRSDACGAAEMWAEYLGRHQENLSGTGVFGDPGVASAVKNDALGIGYNNVNYVFDLNTRLPYPGLVVIPVDLNSNGVIDDDENFYGTLDSLNEAIRNGKYPSPPARPLYFVAKSKPEKKVVTEFLKWILINGQQFVEEAGYVSLPEDFINKELVKID